MINKAEPLFFWRDTINPPFEFRDLLYITGVPKCKYCEFLLEKDVKLTSGTSQYGTGIANVNCTICGWGLVSSYYDNGEGETVYTGQKEKIILRIDDLNSDELCYNEIAESLKFDYERIQLLSPRKVELLIADVFRNYGYKVIVTKQTRDGGADIILFDNNGTKSLVEVKRHKNKLGVEFVRKLLGVQLIRNVSYARLITTGQFSKSAEKEAKLNNSQTNGFNIELCDASVLLELLEVYNGNNNLIKHQKIIEKFR